MNTDKIYAQAVANEYAPKNTSKVVALKKLDHKAKMPENIFAYSFGVIMSLIFGLGLCLSMKVIGSGSNLMMVLGIIIGIIGISGISINYPIYKKMLENGKKKYAFEIIQLVKEICEKAGVNRSTFYLHYETLGDLLQETTEYIHSQFLRHLRKVLNNLLIVLTMLH